MTTIRIHQWFDSLPTGGWIEGDGEFAIDVPTELWERYEAAQRALTEIEDQLDALWGDRP